ncbi:TetR family transcriptional regulator [Conexibacter arvalis]|uniref:AcrR family transcriptional regulator n=1 Tax=Conexibacter arvalis TaxID=912552 RepID=A0A840IDW0_9ACTN|nr:TetR family transcriptional regulator [Conexibacter arvalis]MBB4662952.1 AcrR family transcriptional regulator [Conexibacter arvalis]
MSNVDERIRAAGRRAFARWGYAGATVERIAGEAGLSRVTLHRRGIDRDVVLAALAEEADDAYRRAMWPALTGSGSGRERIEQALAALCAAAEAELEVLLALRGRRDAIFHDDSPSGTRAAFVEPLARLLRDGAADGSLHAFDDPDTAATVLFNQVGTTYLHLRSDHRWEAERCRDALLDLTLRGLVSGST